MNPLWIQVSESLKSRLSPENYETWIKPIHCDVDGDGAWILSVPNQFYIDWISSHYLDLIEHAGRDQGCPKLHFKWNVDESLALRSESTSTPVVHGSAAPRATSQEAGTPLFNSTDAAAFRNSLNPKYGFDNFIVGPSNELAHASCLAAASCPGRRYNPLFIYGGVGLGKTHLVNAVVHAIQSNNPRQRILYVSAEQFTNEFITALQRHQIDSFRRRYREQCDVLLMDDIQFLSGRVQTQEEFFHTFNALYHNDKQIVVTSDAYPQQIAEMQQRLISRFQWGLVADIQPPEIDTRVAILKNKAEQEGLQISDDVILYVAQVISNNVRELEGCLLRLAVKAELLKSAIDLELAKKTLLDKVSRQERALSVEEIQKIVCDYFNIRLVDLKSHRKNRTISVPRMIAMYLCRQHLNLSYPELGERFGGKDHSTVINAVRRISSLIDKDENNIRGTVEALETRFSRGLTKAS